MKQSHYKKYSLYLVLTKQQLIDKTYMQGLEQPHVQMGTERIIHEYEIVFTFGEYFETTYSREK